MRKHLMLAVLITLINPPSGVASLQSAKDVAGNQSSSATSNLTSAEAQADFDLMRKALEEAHTGLYRFTTTAKLHPGVAEQPPGKYLFMGKVFVLIDGGTFSTAADFCAVTHHLKRATFIGEETGGGYYGNNSGMQTVVTLPNSKTQIRVPMYEYWNAVPGYDGKRRGTRPDHLVETKAANLLRGVDEQLELAMKLADQTQSQEKK